MAYDKIETQLTLLGATGVEDKLQVGVPQTICALREAGIKVKYSEDDLCSLLSINVNSEVQYYRSGTVNSKSFVGKVLL